VNADDLNAEGLNAADSNDRDANNGATIDGGINADGLSDVRGRMQELADFAITRARLGEPEPIVLTAGDERANRRGAILVGVAAVAAVVVTAGIALVWTSGSARVETVARPEAPSLPAPTSVVPPAPRIAPSVPVATTTTTPEPEVALPDAYRVFFGVSGMELNWDVEYDDEPRDLGDTVQIIQAPLSGLAGPIAMVVMRPPGTDERLVGRPVTAADGTSGVATSYGDLGLVISWAVDQTVLSLTTYGFDEPAAVELMARLEIDPADPDRLLLAPDPNDDLEIAAQDGLWPDADYRTGYCGVGGGISLWREPAIPRSLIGLVVSGGNPVEELSLESGEWLLARRSPENVVAVAISDASMLVVSITGVDPVPLLNSATPVSEGEWDEFREANNASPEPQQCSLPSASEEAEAVDRPSALLFGEILLSGDIPVGVCDGVGPGVPARRSGAAPDAPVTSDSAGALSSYVEWWTPGVDQPNNMPARGWWAIPDGDSVAYAWDGGSGETVPDLFFIVLYTERGPDGWSVARWESSGC